MQWIIYWLAYIAECFDQNFSLRRLSYPLSSLTATVILSATAGF